MTGMDNYIEFEKEPKNFSLFSEVPENELILKYNFRKMLNTW